MRFTNVPGGLINSSNGRPASTGTKPCWTARPPRTCKSPNNRHLGEPCPLVLLIMPLCLPLFLTMRFRKWLRRRVGRKAGNVIGKIAIMVLGRPPLILACVIIRLISLALKLMDKLEQRMCRR
jgi:hypothetical protein